MLTGCYEKYCSATKLTIVEIGGKRRSRYENQEEANEFLSYITPAVERF
jgi:hypothetical protein